MFYNVVSSQFFMSSLCLQAFLQLLKVFLYHSFCCFGKFLNIVSFPVVEQ